MIKKSPKNVLYKALPQTIKSLTLKIKVLNSLTIYSANSHKN